MGCSGWCAPGRRNLHRGLECDAGRLVELPSHWGLDDWAQYVQSMDLDYMMPIRAPEQGFAAFAQEFEAAYRHGAPWVPVVHPFATGRFARWEVVHRFLEQVLKRGDVWFAPMEEIAAHVRTVVDKGRGRRGSTGCPTTPSRCQVNRRIDPLAELKN